MNWNSFLVTVIQLSAVVQVWLVPFLISSLFFNGIRDFYIISACLMILPILFNLVVMSHYWSKPLLVIGLLANGIGGAGAMATVVIAWADPNYNKQRGDSPNMAQGNVIMLIVAIITTFSSAMQIVLLCMKSEPNRSYSCCWGNFSEAEGREPKAKPYFIHLIRCMRGIGIITLIINMIQIWSFIFYFYGNDNTSLTTFRIRILSLFYFTMTFLWGIITTVLSYNINSQRKLRFAAFNGILILLASGFIMALSFGIDKSPGKQSGPSPWVIISILPFELFWVICAFIIAYSKHPFQSNGCCWPDCTSPNTLDEQFDFLQEDDDGLWMLTFKVKKCKFWPCRYHPTLKLPGHFSSNNKNSFPSEFVIPSSWCSTILITSLHWLFDTYFPLTYSSLLARHSSNRPIKSCILSPWAETVKICETGSPECLNWPHRSKQMFVAIWRQKLS